MGADEHTGNGAEPLEPVEEDPSQPTCAISGEPFERSYDPETDKWYYDDAVVLTGEKAAHYGVMEGSIVKATCLAGAPPANANEASTGGVSKSAAGPLQSTEQVALSVKRESGEQSGPEQKRVRTSL